MRDRHVILYSMIWAQVKKQLFFECMYIIIGKKVAGLEAKDKIAGSIKGDHRCDGAGR